MCLHDRRQRTRTYSERVRRRETCTVREREKKRKREKEIEEERGLQVAEIAHISLRPISLRANNTAITQHSTLITEAPVT